MSRCGSFVRHPVFAPASFPFALHFLVFHVVPFLLAPVLGEREWGGQVVVPCWVLGYLEKDTLFLDFVYVTSSLAWWTDRFLRAQASIGRGISGNIFG